MTNDGRVIGLGLRVQLTFARGPAFFGSDFLVALGLVTFALATPSGLEPLAGVASDFFATLGAVVRLRVAVGAVSTAWKMRGRELPVWDRVPSRTMLI